MSLLDQQIKLYRAPRVVGPSITIAAPAGCRFHGVTADGVSVVVEEQPALRMRSYDLRMLASGNGAKYPPDWTYFASREDEFDVYHYVWRVSPPA